MRGEVKCGYHPLNADDLVGSVAGLTEDFGAVLFTYFVPEFA